MKTKEEILEEVGISRFEVTEKQWLQIQLAMEIYSIQDLRDMQNRQNKKS